MEAQCLSSILQQLTLLIYIIIGPTCALRLPTKAQSNIRLNLAFGAGLPRSNFLHAEHVEKASRVLTLSVGEWIWVWHTSNPELMRTLWAFPFIGVKGSFFEKQEQLHLTQREEVLECKVGFIFLHGS